jgi:hypothetical protein
LALEKFFIKIVEQAGQKPLTLKHLWNGTFFGKSTSEADFAPLLGQAPPFM